MRAGLKNKNHDTIIRFIGEHTFVTPPRPGIKEALREKIYTHAYETAHNPNQQVSRTPRFSKKTVKFAALFLGVFTVALGLFLQIPHGKEQSNSAFAASLISFEGEVQVHDEYTNEWKLLDSLADLHANQTIKVSESSKATIKISDGSILRLDANSEITIDDLQNDTVVISNNSGNVYAVIAENESRDFVIKTNDISYETNGTTVHVTNTNEKKGIDVFKNNVTVLDNGEKIAEVGEGNRFYTAHSENPSLEQQITSVENPEIMNDTFIQWNESENEKETQSDVSVALSTLPPVALSAEYISKSGSVSILISDPVGEQVKRVSVVKDGAIIITSDIMNNAYSFEVEKNKTYFVSVCFVEDNTCITKDTSIAVNTQENAETSDVPISITAEQKTKGIFVSWNITDTNLFTQGELLQVLFSNTTNEPKYFEVGAKLVNDVSAGGTTLPLQDGKIYFVRVCRYNATTDTCDMYSNIEYAVAPK